MATYTRNPILVAFREDLPRATRDYRGWNIWLRRFAPGRDPQGFVVTTEMYEHARKVPTRLASNSRSGDV